MSPLRILARGLGLRFVVGNIISLMPSIILSVVLKVGPIGVVVAVLVPVVFSLFSKLLKLVFSLGGPGLS